jgi:hypothetical protein
LLVAAGAGGWIWLLNDDGDLVEVLAVARSRGIATSAAELALQAPPPARLAIWRKIASLAPALKSYDSTNSWKSAVARLKPFEPVPEQLRMHHAGLDSMGLPKLLAAIDELGGAPLVLHTEFSISTPLPEIGIYRDLIRLLAERVALAEPESVAAEMQRMWTFVGTYDDHLLISHLVRASLISLCVGATVRRLDELKPRDPGLADVIERCAEALPHDLDDGLAGEFIAAVGMVRNPPPAISSLGGAVGAAGWWDRTTTPVVFRLGRRPLLQFEMDWITTLRNAAGPEAVLRASADLDARNDIRDHDPSLILRTMVASSYPTVVDITYQTLLHCRLVVAELRGTAWPKDLFDPAGGTLRRIVREGRVMGGYTVGHGGIDAGGKRPGNRYFPLYGPLEPPSAVSSPPTR